MQIQVQKNDIGINHLFYKIGEMFTKIEGKNNNKNQHVLVLSKYKKGKKRGFCCTA